MSLIDITHTSTHTQTHADRQTEHDVSTIHSFWLFVNGIGHKRSNSTNRDVTAGACTKSLFLALY